MGCKLVGTVKGTEIWAGNYVDASELRGTKPAEEVSPSPPVVAPPERNNRGQATLLEHAIAVDFSPFVISQSVWASSLQQHPSSQSP